MKVILINGSPRKNWNTHTLLMEAEKGAKEAGADTELFHLYDLDFKDCRSCFACKLKGNQTNGICAIADSLKPVYEKIMDADGLIVGSPIYYGNMTGETISFLHRLFFPTMHYQNDGVKLVKKPKKCGLILTMNVTEAGLDSTGYRAKFDGTAQSIGAFLGSCETLYSCDTWQFTDYSKYYAGMFDAKHKAEHRKKQFPIDRKNAYELGGRIANGEA